jgi:WD40 repeat protein
MAEAALVREQLCGDLQQPITALAWSADGEFLAIASAGGELLLLDFRAGCEELLRGDCDSSLDVLAFSGDGQFLMAVGQGGELLLWELGGTGVRPLALEPMPLGAAWIDAAAWQPEPLLWHERRVNALAFAPGSTLLASASSDGSVALWDGRGRMLQPLEGQGSGFNVLAWRPDGHHLVAGDANGRWWLWPVDVPQRERQGQRPGNGFQSQRSPSKKNLD